MWFVALLAGNTAAYACRTTMPLVSPVIAKDLSWSKTEAGTVLSSFFWGYALTQVLTVASLALPASSISKPIEPIQKRYLRWNLSLALKCILYSITSLTPKSENHW